MEPSSAYPFESTQGEQAEQTRRFVWRVAALMLLVYTLISVVVALLNPSQVSGRQWMYQIVNVVLVFGLIKGLSWAYSWALLRVGLGAVLLIVQVATKSLAPELLIDALLYVLIGVVLIGTPHRTRAKGAGALFVLVLVVFVAYPLASGRNPVADPVLEQVAVGFQHLEQGDPDTAVQVFRSAIDKQPDLAEAHNGLAVAYYSLDRTEEALVEMNRALDLETEDAAFWGNRAAVLMELERYEECLPDADQAIALKPDFADFHDTRATCLTELERYDEAVAAATRAIELDGASPYFYITRGWAYWGLGNFDSARLDWQEAIGKLPADDPAVPMIEDWISEITGQPQ